MLTARRSMPAYPKNGIHLWSTLVIILIVLTSAWLLGSTSSLLLLGGLVALFTGVLLLIFPEIGLTLLVATAYLVPIEVPVSEAVSANAVILLLPLLFLIWLVGVFRSHGRNLHWSRTYTPLLVFLFVAFIAWFVGNATWNPFYPQPRNLPWIQLGQWSMYAFSVIAYILAAHQTVRWLRWMVIAFLGFGVLALVRRYGGPLGEFTGHWMRPFATENGSFFVWMTAMAAGQSLFNHDLKPMVRLSLFLLALAVPILGFWQSTDWASSWFPPLIALAILAWLRSRVLSLTLLLASMLLLALFSSMLLAAYDWEFEREISIEGRFLLWGSVLELAFKSPWIGLGLTQYHQYFRFLPLLTDRGRWYQPNVNSHNLYVDLFAQVGVIGLGVFIWAIVEIGALGWRLSKDRDFDFGTAYVMSALSGLGAMLVASAIVEWLIPFVYNVGFYGFRFSVISWIFFGGLVVIQRGRVLPPSQTLVATKPPSSIVAGL